MITYGFRVGVDKPTKSCPVCGFVAANLRQHFQKRRGDGMHTAAIRDALCPPNQKS